MLWSILNSLAEISTFVSVESSRKSCYPTICNNEHEKPAMGRTIDQYKPQQSTVSLLSALASKLRGLWLGFFRLWDLSFLQILIFQGQAHGLTSI